MQIKAPTACSIIYFYVLAEQMFKYNYDSKRIDERIDLRVPDEGATHI